MSELPINKYVRYLFVISMLIFVLNKLIIRPWILENNISGFLLILTYSLPNFIEAIVGTLLLTRILLVVRHHSRGKISKIKDTYVHLFALSIAATYVLTQELKFHNLGGRNVYDPYDLIASIIGLSLTFGIIQIWGINKTAEN